MATYGVGDVQGCFLTLRRLVERIRFDPAIDRLWLVGDLVNRGPRSLEVLRWVRDLGDRATVVLGNHDLHLLARGEGVCAPRPLDTLDDVLVADDGPALLEWLRTRPLLHREDPYVLVHAGLLPAWSVDEAERLAREAEGVLRGDRRAELLAALGRRGASPRPEPLEPIGRIASAAVVLTRLRVCDADGALVAGFHGPPEGAPPGTFPWFAAPGRRSASHTIVFGHWAALGLHRTAGLIGLDTGCVWGGRLTAIRLDDGTLFQEPLADG